MGAGSPLIGYGYHFLFHSDFSIRSGDFLVFEYFQGFSSSQRSMFSSFRSLSVLGLNLFMFTLLDERKADKCASVYLLLSTRAIFSYISFFLLFIIITM